MDEVVKELILQKARQIFGSTYILNSLERIFGGAQKYTYLGTASNGFKFIVYIWDKSTSYFYDDNPNAVFVSSSAELFELNNKLMTKYGINVPKLYYMDRSRVEQPYDYALVEYIEGVDMDEVIARQPQRLEKVLVSLKRNMDQLHHIKSKEVGQLNQFQPTTFNLIEFALKAAQENIDYLIQVDDENKVLYLKVSKLLEQLAQKMTERDEYTFIHGELGPNHVIVDKNNEAFLIDIEGAKYADIEEEVSFLKIRFGSYYDALVKETFDFNRMAFNHLCHCVGNLSGAMELKSKQYYDMDDVNGMIVYFIGLLRNAV